jgi:hypothetical protein
MNVNILVPKTGAYQIGPKKQDSSFLKNYLNGFD